jgi:hypothetical protein
MGRKKNAPDVGAYVYVFNSAIPNVYKIGVSVDPAQRLTEVGYSKHVITSAFFQKRQTAYSVERDFHNELRGKQIKNAMQYKRLVSLGSEWFQLTIDELCDVCYELLQAADEYGVTPTSYALGMYVIERQRFAKGYLQRSKHGDDDE